MHGSTTVMLICSFAAAALGAQAEANLIRNGDFEQVSVGNPEAWTLTQHGNECSLGVGKGADGQHAARLSCTTFHKGWAIAAQDGVVKVRKGQWYRLTFKCRTEGLRGAPSVALFNRKPWRNIGLQQRLEAGPKWTPQDIRFQATRDSADTRFEFYFSTTGALYLDDVKLVACEPPPLKGALPLRPKGNLVLNGSFELGGYLWGTEGRDSLAATPVAGGPCGNTCLRIQVDPETADEYAVDWFEPRTWKVYGNDVSSAAWMALDPGKPAVLSAYLRSGDRPVRARLAIGAMTNRVFDVGPEWRRYEAHAKAGCHGCYVTLGIVLDKAPQPCELYIDGVQLEQADAASDFAPREPIELALSTPRYGNVFMADETPVVEVAAHAAVQASVDVMVKVTDGWDAVVQERTLRFKCRAGETARRSLRLQRLKKGFFRVTATVHGQPGLTPATLRLAKVEPLDKLFAGADGPFGINHASPAPSRLPLMRMAGITWVRDWTLKWHQVQPADGAAFDFTMGDLLIDRWRKHGFHVMCVLPYPATPWCTTAPADSLRTGRGQPFRRTLSYMPAAVGKFGDFVHATVEHFKDRVRVWEILNEPSANLISPTDYAKLLAVAYARAKQAAPECRVIGGYSAAPGSALDRYERLFALGSLKHMDLVNLHPYPGSSAGHSYIESLTHFNACMDRHGGRVPIWDTEYLYCSDDDPLPTVQTQKKPAGACRSELEAASRMVQYNVTFLAHGAEKLFQHTNHWPLRLTRDTLLFSMFFDYGPTPKKPFAAHSAMAWLLGPKPKPSGFLSEDGRYCAIFETDRGALAVLWQDQWADEKKLVVPAGATAYDMMGNVVLTRRITLSESPVYLQGEATLAKQLETALRGPARR